MNTLIIEDDVTNGLFLQQLLKDYGPSRVAVNGKEGVEAVHKLQPSLRPLCARLSQVNRRSSQCAS